MGEDKLKVLRNYNLESVLPKNRSTIIHQLWNGFDNLYTTLQKSSKVMVDKIPNTINWGSTQERLCKRIWKFLQNKRLNIEIQIMVHFGMKK